MIDVESLRAELDEAEENMRFFDALSIFRASTRHNLAAEAARSSAESWARKAESLRFAITRALLNQN